MRLNEWLKQQGELGSWSHRQPLEPFPTFQNRCVAAGWEQVERYALHQMRRGVPVPERLYWFRRIDEGWEEPTSMLHLIVPSREVHPQAEIFHLGCSSDPNLRCRELEGDGDLALEVFQQWPGSQSLAAALHRALHPLRARGEWYRFVQEDVMQLTGAMDIVTAAWAHHRYWFGLRSL